MGRKQQLWTRCDGCGDWVFNWRLQSNGNKCHCGATLVPYGEQEKQDTRKPKANTLAQLLEDFCEKATGQQKQLGVEMGKKLQEQVAQAKPAVEEDTWKVHNTAKHAAGIALSQRDKANRKLSEAKEAIESAREELVAKQQVLDKADKVASIALQAYTKTKSPNTQVANEETGFDKLLECSVFDDLEEVDCEETQKFLQQAKEDYEKMQKNTREQLERLDHMRKEATAKKASSPKKKRKGEEGQAVEATGAKEEPGEASQQQQPTTELAAARRTAAELEEKADADRAKKKLAKGGAKQDDEAPVDAADSRP